MAPQVLGTEDKTREEFPVMLDHMLLGCSDLDSGIAWMGERCGVRAAYGGSHPGRGTRNALLSLGGLHYLEIFAPDPDQKNLDSAREQVALLKQLSIPKLVGWAAHPGNLAQLAGKLRESSIGFSGPWPGSRKRPDGNVLSWQR